MQGGSPSQWNRIKYRFHRKVQRYRRGDAGATEVPHESADDNGMVIDMTHVRGGYYFSWQMEGGKIVCARGVVVISIYREEMCVYSITDSTPEINCLRLVYDRVLV